MKEKFRAVALCHNIEEIEPDTPEYALELLEGLHLE